MERNQRVEGKDILNIFIFVHYCFELFIYSLHIFFFFPSVYIVIFHRNEEQSQIINLDLENIHFNAFFN